MNIVPPENQGLYTAFPVPALATGTHIVQATADGVAQNTQLKLTYDALTTPKWIQINPTGFQYEDGTGNISTTWKDTIEAVVNCKYLGTPPLNTLNIAGTLLLDTANTLGGITASIPVIPVITLF